MATKMRMEQPHGPGNNKKMRYRLWDCQQRGEFCDIILESDGGDLVFAHRVVLASSSPVLYSMLGDPNICDKDDESGMQTLKLPEVSKESLYELVRFSYIGDVEQINMDTVSLWERFQIYEPITLCEEAPNTEVDAKSSVPTKPVEKVSDIKSEQDSFSYDEDNGNIEDWDDPNDSDYEEQKSSKKKSAPQQRITNEIKDMNLRDGGSEPISLRRRKRKCSFPKHLETKEDVPYNEESSEDNVPIQTLLKKKRTRSKQKEASGNTDEGNEPDGDYKPSPAKVKKLKIKKPKKDPIEKEKKIPKPPYAPPTRCKSCNVEFDSQEEYKDHRQTMHNKKFHKCLDCGLSFKRLNKLKAHRLTSHPQEGLPQPDWHHCKVEGCDYKSLYTDVLDRHVKSVHIKERSICETCGTDFSTPYLLTLHRRKAHGEVGKTYKCNECQNIFFLPSELKLHIKRVHEKSKRYLCDQCPFSSFDRNSVTKHMFSKHNVPLPEGGWTTYSCPHCEYKTYNKTVITAHIERHGGENFKCNLCDSMFRCNRDLQGHYRMRHSEKPKITHSCTYEGCKYVSKYGPTQLKKHISRMHENKDHKPFACDICNYRTNVKGNLHLHIRKVHRLEPQIQQHRVPKCVPDQQDEPVAPSKELMKQNIASNPDNTNASMNPSPSLNPDVASNPMHEGFQGCPPTTYQDMSKTESAPVQGTPTYHMLSAAENMTNRLPAGVPVMPGAHHFGLMLPSFGYDESLYSRAPPNQMN